MPLASIALGLCLLSLPKPTEIIFVRHGETLANATGRYNSKTIDTFSPLGQKQVATLTKELEGVRFDRIVVSPSPRALRTIAPFLRSHPGVRVEVWPELYECCDAHSRKRPSQMANGIKFAGKICLPSDVSELFTLSSGADRFLAINSYDDGLKAIRLAAANLQKKFAGQTVLVVGHSLHGGRMIELLTGKTMEGKVRPQNCRIYRFRQTAGGAFAPAG